MENTELNYDTDIDLEIDSSGMSDDVIEEDSIMYKIIDSSGIETFSEMVVSSVDLMSADLNDQLTQTNNLLLCIVFALFIMYFRTIIFSIRRGVF